MKKNMACIFPVKKMYNPGGDLFKQMDNILGLRELALVGETSDGTGLV